MKLEHSDAAHYREMIFDRIKQLNLVKPTSEVNPQKTPQPFVNSIHMSVVGLDTISAVLAVKRTNPNAKTAVLNFASYKHPGGGFMTDMLAQEEAICYCTNLYPELAAHQDWYDKHANTLNHGIYQNESILTHNITVLASRMGCLLNPSELVLTDILTCAAPQWGPALRYKTLTPRALQMATQARVDYVIKTLSQDNYDTLILGAFGCGVFKNDPIWVAQCFKKAIADYYGCFKEVIFAIPDVNSTNHQAFMRVFSA